MLVTIDVVRFAPGRAQRELLTTWRHPPGRQGWVIFSANLTTIPGPMVRWTEVGCLSTWDSAADRDAFDARAPLARRWAEHAREHCTLLLDPVKSHGALRGSDPIQASGSRVDGPALVLTSARMTARGYIPVWRTNPAIVRHLRQQPGLLWHHAWADHVMGLGTLSLWADGSDATRFAYGGDSHRRGIEGGRRKGWLSESLFSRFRLLEARGTLGGRRLPVPE